MKEDSIIFLAQNHMFKSQQDFTNSLFGAYAYEPIIARNTDHILIRLNRLIDWSFVEEEVADCYSSEGRSALHPVMMLKFLILQKLFDRSEREVMVDTDCNIINRYFVGLGLTEDVPHWTDLGKFKERIGTDRLENLFYRVLEEAERLGIEIGQKRIVDATDVIANVDTARCVKDKNDDDDHDFIDRNTSDTDARFGSKGKGKRSWYGYKSSTNMDAKTDLVTAVWTTDASIPDGAVLPTLIDAEQAHRGEDAIAAQGGDKGYVGNQAALSERKVRDYTIPRDNMKIEKRRKDRNPWYRQLKHLRYKIERKQSEAKNRHGLGKARYRGLQKVHWQGLLTYIAINLKRIANILLPVQRPTW